MTSISAARKAQMVVGPFVAALTLAITMIAMLGASPTPSSSMALNPVLVDQLGGLANAAAARDHYAFLAVGPRVVVFDVADPTSPVEVARTDRLAGVMSNVHDITLHGQLAYIAAGDGGLVILDISDPERPDLVSIQDTPYHVLNVAVDGDYAYLTDGNFPYFGDCWGALRVYDVSVPSEPAEIGNVARYSCTSIASTALLARDGLVFDEGRIYDVSDPASPTLVTTYIREGFGVRGVALVGNYAYYALGEGGLVVVDISDPENLTEHFYYSRDTHDIYIEDGLAYFSGFGYDYGLRVFDVAVPTAPELLGSMGGPGEGLAPIHDIEGGIGFGPETWYTNIYDLSDPQTPALLHVHRFLASPWKLALDGNFLYVADERGAYLHILDVTDREKPVPRGTYDTPHRARDVKTSGCCAFVPALNYGDVAPSVSGLHIIDVTEPHSPTQEAFYDVGAFPQDPRAVAIGSDNHAYLAVTGCCWPNYQHTLIVLDIADPANPVEVSSELSWENAEITDMEIRGDTLYIVRGSFLTIVDVSEPTNPTEMGQYQSPEKSWTVDVVGDYAYFAGGRGGLQIVDVSDPVAPTEVASLVPGIVFGVNANNQTVFLATDQGLRIVDVSDPVDPKILGGYDDVGGYDVLSDGDTVYYASNFQGIFVFRLEEVIVPPTPTATATVTATTTPTATLEPPTYLIHLPALSK